MIAATNNSDRFFPLAIFYLERVWSPCKQRWGRRCEKWNIWFKMTKHAYYWQPVHNVKVKAINRRLHHSRLTKWFKIVCIMTLIFFSISVTNECDWTEKLFPFLLNAIWTNLPISFTTDSHWSAFTHWLVSFNTEHCTRYTAHIYATCNIMLNIQVSELPFTIAVYNFKMQMFNLYKNPHLLTSFRKVFFTEIPENLSWWFSSKL
jgi:hypothetical protein